MTTPSTGDARAETDREVTPRSTPFFDAVQSGRIKPDELPEAEERVVEAVGQAVFVEMDNRGLLKSVGDDLLDEVSEAVARAAIEAYRKAMREGK